ncbi:MAG: PP2C family protein-serine/threonine phosphatase [Crocinitomicaceae bacterium]|jgi:sigma-B regulation protein RsbU (phosphoserine phosphatase)|nr:PP2C family protein-serine/threonine phosphatase [Crocinitomicaceae bacterium]MDP5099042.1 PP2C family protein-serine/threonine phosphatase [Crocinitomicaceae bacterium]
MTDKLVKELENQLKLKDFKLNSLLEITNAINLNQGVDQLMRIYEFILKEQLGFGRFVLFNLQEDWNCLSKVGIKGKLKEIDIKNDLGRFKEITVIESSHSSLLSEFDIIVPIFHKDTPLAYLLIAGIQKEGNKITDSLSYMSFVQTLTNIIVVAIENKRMTRQSLIQERIKKELEVASEMQKLLFPADLPSNRRMDISAKYTPRHEVGGDYYDFIPLGDEEYIICIADVSGKGISAAMLMANFQATIRTLFNYQRFDMEFLMEELNKKVMRSAKGEKFITFFIAHYNAHTRELKYVNAGHNHPILTNGRKVEMLDQGCIGLGMMDELPFINVGRLTLKPNTTMVLFTDGVVELENELGEFFNIDRLIKMVHSYYPLKMEDMNNLIFSKLDEWKGNLPLVDDTAIFSCRFF